VQELNVKMFDKSTNKQTNKLMVVFDCTCNTQNFLLLNQHDGDDAPQD